MSLERTTRHKTAEIKLFDARKRIKRP